MSCPVLSAAQSLNQLYFEMYDVVPNTAYMYIYYHDSIVTTIVKISRACEGFVKLINLLAGLKLLLIFSYSILQNCLVLSVIILTASHQMVKC
jgi:hypothetical protein